MKVQEVILRAMAKKITWKFGSFVIDTGADVNHIDVAANLDVALRQVTANNQPCPTPNTVIQGPGFTFTTATCQGNTGYNNFFGKGIVDALKAVTYH
jgi:hypothetical protein